MNKENPRCLIGTLYSGENELNACEAALKKQSYTNWEHVRFDYLPELEAHEKLYKTFMNNSRYFDLFIKLDSDMIFKHKDVLIKIINFFKRRNYLDHACFSVSDYMTNKDILGLHVFSNKSRWQLPLDRYFPDQNPDIPGAHLLVKSSPAPVAFHSNNPTLYQAFHFGTHRMFKAKYPVSPGMEAFQLNVIYWVFIHSLLNPDPRLRFVLLGAFLVWNGDIDKNAINSHDSIKINIFNHYLNLYSKSIYQLIPNEWFVMLKRYRRFKRIFYSSKQNISFLKYNFKSFVLKVF